MNAAHQTIADAAQLGGVVTTLRRLYQPRFDMEAAFATALRAIDRNEQMALARIASMPQARQMSGTTA